MVKIGPPEFKPDKAVLEAARAAAGAVANTAVLTARSQGRQLDAEAEKLYMERLSRLDPSYTPIRRNKRTPTLDEQAQVLYLRRKFPEVSQQADEVKQQEILSREVEADISAIQNQNPDAVKHWDQMADITMRAFASGDSDLIELAADMVSKYGDQLKPHMDIEGFQSQYERLIRDPRYRALTKKDQGYLKELWGNFAGGLVKSMSTLDRLREGIQTAWNLAAVDDKDNWREMLAALGRGVTLQEQPEDFYGYKEQITGGDEHVNFGDLLSPTGSGKTVGEFLRDDLQLDKVGIDTGLGRVDLAGVTELAGDILTDPFTYAFSGTPSGANAALRSIEKNMGKEGERLVSVIKRYGMRALSEEEKLIVEKAILELNRSRVIRQYGLETAKRSTRQKLRAALAKADNRLEEIAQQLADRQIKQVYHGGRKGVHVFGHTIVPTSPIKDLLAEFGLAKKVRLIREGVEEGLDDAAIHSKAYEEASAPFRKEGGDFYENELDNLLEEGKDAVGEEARLYAEDMIRVGRQKKLSEVARQAYEAAQDGDLEMARKIIGDADPKVLKLVERGLDYFENLLADRKYRLAVDTLDTLEQDIELVSIIEPLAKIPKEHGLRRKAVEKIVPLLENAKVTADQLMDMVDEHVERMKPVVPKHANRFEVPDVPIAGDTQAFPPRELPRGPLRVPDVDQLGPTSVYPPRTPPRIIDLPSAPKARGRTFATVQEGEEELAKAARRKNLPRTGPGSAREPRVMPNPRHEQYVVPRGPKPAVNKHGTAYINPSAFLGGNYYTRATSKAVELYNEPFRQRAQEVTDLVRQNLEAWSAMQDYLDELADITLRSESDILARRERRIQAMLEKSNPVDDAPGALKRDIEEFNKFRDAEKFGQMAADEANNLVLEARMRENTIPSYHHAAVVEGRAEYTAEVDLLEKGSRQYEDMLFKTLGVEVDETARKATSKEGAYSRWFRNTLGVESDELTGRGVPPKFVSETHRKLWESEQKLLALADEVAQYPVRTSVEQLRKMVLSELLDVKAINWLKSAFVPRAKVISNLGREVADKFDDVVVESLAKLNNRLHDDLVRLDGTLGRRSPLRKAAAREAGGDEKLLRMLNKAMSSPDEFIAMMRSLKKDSAIRKLLTEVDNVRMNTFMEAMQAGAGEALKDTGILGAQWRGYIPRIMTKRARKYFQGLLDTGDETVLEVLSRMGFIKEGKDAGKKITKLIDEGDMVELALNQNGHLLARGIAPEVEDLFEVNRLVSEWLADAGIRYTGDVFETDVIHATAMRARSAHHAVMLADIYRGLTELTDDAGHRLAYIGAPADVTAQMTREGVPMKGSQPLVGLYTRITMPNGHEIWVRDIINSEIENSQRIFGTAGMRDFSKMVNKVNGLWASYATVPLAGFGFHARNALGNVFNTFLAGLKNPAQFASAAVDQVWAYRIRAAMRRTGKSFEEAAKEIGTPDDVLQTLFEARQHGVLNETAIDNLFSDQPGLDSMLANTTNNRFAERVKPWSQNFFVLSTGRAFGQFVEHNARLALFKDQLAKGATPRAASSTVRKFLFDYSDLTKFESENIRVWSRFYTFMRKNTALQYQMFFAHPGRMLNAYRITEAFGDIMAGQRGDSGEVSFFPDWVNETVLTPRGGNLVGVDSPIKAADEAITNLLGWVGVVPGGGQLLQKIGADRGAGDNWPLYAGRAVSLLSGVPPAVVQYLYANVADKDPFTGAPLRGQGTSVDYFMSTFWPLWDKVQRTKKIFVDDGTEDGQKLRILNALTGLQVYDLTKENEAKAIYGLLAELEDAFNNIRRNKGIDVPTKKELREAGKLSAVNQVARILAYSDPEELDQKLVDWLPKPLVEALGVIQDTPLPSDELSEMEIRRRLDEYWKGFQLLAQREGIQLTEADRQRFIFNVPFAPGKGIIDELGLEGDRPNVFDEKAPPEPADLEAAQERLSMIAGIVGVDYNQLAPKLPQAMRVIRDGREKGLSDAEIQYALYDELSRKEAGILFGTDMLPRYRDGSLTQDDLERIRERAWERRAEITAFSLLLYGRRPDEKDVTAYILWNELTQGQLESLGLPKAPKIPRREDIRTEDQKLADTKTETVAAALGAGLGLPVPEPTPTGLGLLDASGTPEGPP